MTELLCWTVWIHAVPTLTLRKLIQSNVNSIMHDMVLVLSFGVLLFSAPCFVIALLYLQHQLGHLVLFLLLLAVWYGLMIEQAQHAVLL